MTEPSFEHLNRLVGSWATEATHPAFEGLVVAGTADIQWLEGERFLIVRSRPDHPDFPDSISIIGATDTDRVGDGTDDQPRDADAPLSMHYFDSRGVFRVYLTDVDDQSWRWWRDAPGFSQRFTGTFGDGGDTITGLSQLSLDDSTWDDDLQITYRRERQRP